MKIVKSVEILNPNIEFLSMVKHPNIMKNFLVAKSQGGNKQLEYMIKSKILQGDEILKSIDLDIEVPEGKHLVVGCAYPVEDADWDDNFMREEAVALVKKTIEANGQKVDTEHDEEERDDVQIVKSVLLEEDIECYDVDGKFQKLKKGSMVTASIVSAEVYKKVEDKKINGYSIGGVAELATEDVDLSTLEKSMNYIKEKFGKKIEKNMFVDMIEEQEKIDKIKRAKWMFSDKWWDLMCDDNDPRAAIETAKEFVEYLETFDFKPKDPSTDDGEEGQEGGNEIAVIIKKIEGVSEEMTEQERAEIKKSIKDEVMQEVNSEIDGIKTENAEMKKTIQGYQDAENQKIEKKRSEDFEEVKAYAVKKAVEITDEDTLETATVKVVKNYDPNFDGDEAAAKGAWAVIKSMKPSEPKKIEKSAGETELTEAERRMLGESDE